VSGKDMPRKQKGGNIYDDIMNNSSVIGSSGSQHVEFKLNDEQTIIAALGSMIYMKGGIQKAELHYDGIGNSFKKILAGETFVYQKFTGSNIDGKLSLGSSFMNNIMILKIKKGDEYRLSKYSFLACTDNVQISMTIQFKGIFGFGTDEGFFLPIASCIDGDYGYIWLSAYGNLQKEEIDEDDSILIDNGMFLACHNTYQYNIETIGKSIFSSFLGNEGFGMKFQGPCVIYIQTKNINDFFVQPVTNNTNGDNVIGITKDIFDAFSEGGYKQKKNKIKTIKSYTNRKEK
jgi:uncharacterized protein (TIGR00266 family)